MRRPSPTTSSCTRSAVGAEGHRRPGRHLLHLRQPQIQHCRAAGRGGSHLRPVRREAAAQCRHGPRSGRPVLPDEADHPQHGALTRWAASYASPCFLGAVGVCLAEGWQLMWAIWAGIAVFAVLGLARHVPVRVMAAGAWRQGRKMCSVIDIYLLIGAITALWRSAGTIGFFHLSRPADHHAPDVPAGGVSADQLHLLRSGHVLRRGGHRGGHSDGAGTLRRRGRRRDGGHHHRRGLFRRPLFSGVLQRGAGGGGHGLRCWSGTCGGCTAPAGCRMR